MPEEAPQLNKPNSDFTANAQTGEAPFEVVFTNASSGTISGYVWSFGDGVVSNDENPSHTFQEPGNYNVSLTVFNAAGSSTHTFRIDVAAPENETEPDRAETVIDLIASIRAGLRRPSEQKLRYRDILDIINDLLRGYARDLQVSEQHHRTDEKTGTIQHIEGNNYLLRVQGVKEVEVMALSFVTEEELRSGSKNLVWKQVTLVPLDYFAARAQNTAALGALFGGMLIEDGVMIKLNLPKETVQAASFRVRYREPLIRLLTISDKTNFPADMLPMIKTEAKLLCLPVMRDDSEDFYKWRKANEPLWLQTVSDWRRRWDDFLTTNTEPSTAPKTSFNEYRRRRRHLPGYTIERRN